MSENVLSLSYQYSLKSSLAANFVKNLGVWFDADFSFSEHVKGNCKAFFLQMGDLHRIRQYLTPELAVLGANTLVRNHLDCCKSQFRGLSCSNQHN